MVSGLISLVTSAQIEDLVIVLVSGAAWFKPSWVSAVVVFGVMSIQRCQREEVRHWISLSGVQCQDRPVIGLVRRLGYIRR